MLQLASFVAGQKLPLSQLVAAVQPLFRAPGNEAPVEEAVLRSKIIELAGRKSYGPKDGESFVVCMPYASLQSPAFCKHNYGGASAGVPG